MEPVTLNGDANASNKTITLSDGRVAVIRDGKGSDSIAAQRLMGGKSELYFAALMSLLVTVGEKSLLMEDFLEMPLKDFTKIQVELADNAF